MTYQEVIDWLFSQLPNYQKQGGSAYKPGLETISSLLNKLDNPQEKFRSIHIAGTNGKGSVSHILASVFTENGYKTGLFTSPHISDFRERIKIDGKLISKEFVTNFVEENKDTWGELNASFFEITTAMAFSAFVEEKCDIVIVETGLGGRLDSTNIVNPELSVITNISLDHTSFLGNTIGEVAIEKAGIIKKGVPVVIGERQDEIADIFIKTAAENSSPIVFAEITGSIESDLIGHFQQKNLSTSLTAVRKLQELGFHLNEEKIANAFKKVQENAGLIGRMQLLGTSPLVILDAAHNVNGMLTLLEEIDNLEFKNLHIVYGSSNDKDINTIFKCLPKDASYSFTTFNSKRSLSQNDLKELADENNLSYVLFNSPKLALENTQLHASENDLILIFGSFYLMESILN